MSEADHDRLIEAAMRREAQVVGEHVDDGLLLRYRAQRLDEPTEKAIDEHLATCTECRALLSALAEPVADRQRSWAQAELTSRGRARWWGLGLGVAAIAAALLFAIIRPPPRDFDEYQLDGLHGLVKLERGSDVTQTNRAVPESRITLRLLPPEPKDEKLAVGVFEVEDGLLHRVAADIRERQSVFGVEVVGEKLFGEGFGPRRMVVVLAEDEAALARLDGAPADQPISTGRAWTFDLEYERGSDP